MKAIVKENMNLKPIFPLFFLNTDISLTIRDIKMTFTTHVNNIHMEGTVSQIFFIYALVFILYKKKNG